MNFLQDEDGVTKKDIAFIVVMFLFSIIFIFLLSVSYIVFTTKGLSVEVMEILRMVFDAISKMAFVVISFFFGSSIMNSTFKHFGFVSKAKNKIQDEFFDFDDQH